MNYTCCAQIKDNIVTQVILCRDVHWAISHLGGEWVLIYDGQSCGIGYAWDGENFVAPEIVEVENDN